MQQQTVYFGGGCFWCVEAVLESLRGVEDVVSGYMGGDAKPTYEEVCGGNTGHVEVVRVTFDADVIPFKTLLSVFFATHDPTTLNRQGNDVGTQYRSVIFYENEEQKKQAEAVIKHLDADKTFGKPIVTSVEPASVFYEAEAHHQDYYRRNSEQGYCSVVISPKVAKLRQTFAPLLKP